jgi:hypothetical protein
MNLQIGRSLSIVLQTMPYLLYRALVYGIVAAGAVLALGVIAGIGSVFGGGAAVVLFLIAIAAGGFGVRLLREYVLYLLQAGHIAVITEIVERGSLPPGVTQTAWGREQVLQSFKEVSILAGVDLLVKGILQALNRSLFNVITLLPLPGGEGLARIVQRIARFSLTYVDEAILAYTFKTNGENVFAAARTGVLLYCQSWQAILKNALALTVISYLFVIVAAVAFLVPLGLIAALLPAAWGIAKFLLFITALMLAVALKWILFDPVACTATLLVFLQEAARRTPDPEWEERLAQVSDRFRELTAKATAASPR